MKEKQSGQAATERESMLKDLATAYDIYMELIGNLQEGTKVEYDYLLVETSKYWFLCFPLLFSFSFTMILRRY